MKISRNQLRRLINEEYRRVLHEELSKDVTGKVSQLAKLSQRSNEAFDKLSNEDKKQLGTFPKKGSLQRLKDAQALTSKEGRAYAAAFKAWSTLQQQMMKGSESWSDDDVSELESLVDAAGGEIIKEMQIRQSYRPKRRRRRG